MFIFPFVGKRGCRVKATRFLGGGGGTQWLLWREWSCQAISQTPKYVDQIFRNPKKLCWPIFFKKLLFIGNSVLEHFSLKRHQLIYKNLLFKNSLKISDPKYVNLPSILDPKYFFQSSKSQTPNMLIFPKFQTPYMYMITPVIKVNESPQGHGSAKGNLVCFPLIGVRSKFLGGGRGGGWGGG